MINVLFTIGVTEILIGVGILILTLILVLVIKALCFNDKTNYRVHAKELDIEKDYVVYKLGELIKIPTVSYEDESLVSIALYIAL